MGCPELPMEYFFEMTYTYDPDGNLTGNGFVSYG